MSQSIPPQDLTPILLPTNNPAKQDTLRWLLIAALLILAFLAHNSGGAAPA